MVTCPSCGEENPAKFRLCGFCGTPLAPVAPPQEVRKTVTIVFSDLKGSTTMGEALDSESLGEVVAGDPSAGQRLVVGDAVNVAARLEQAAPAMEVLLGELTYRLVRDAVEVEAVEPLELKGKSERVPAFRLVSVGVGEGYARRADLPLVGREAELAALRAAFDEAAASGEARLVSLLADAGVGKARPLRAVTTPVGGQ